MREIGRLEAIDSLLEWDQETYMPPGGLKGRSEQRALAARLKHERLTAPELGELLSSLEPTGDDAVLATNVREMRRQYDRAVKLPTDLVARIASRESRFLSRAQEFFWPPLIVLPFITGYACANWALGPTAYQLSMLLHLLSAELIFVLLPFTMIAHCVLMPFSQIVSNLAWRFPAETDDDVCATLNKKGAPV